MKRLFLLAGVVLLVAVACMPPVEPPPGNLVMKRPGSSEPVRVAGATITPNGRFVVFTSSQSNVVPGLVPHDAAIYRWDRANGGFVAVSVSTDGGPLINTGTRGADAVALPNSVSDDGRYVVYSSAANNATSGDTQIFFDVYLRDISSNATTWISSMAGVGGNRDSTRPSISPNGRWVSFESTATNLGTPGAPGDLSQPEGQRNIYRWDRVSGQLVRVTVGMGSAGSVVVDANADSGGLWLANRVLDDGRVLFSSQATNIVATPPPVDPGATEPAHVIYLANPDLRTVEVVSKGTTGNVVSGVPLDITDSGRYLLFASNSLEVIPSDDDPYVDVYLRDLQTGTVERVITTSSGSSVVGDQPSISADGRYVALRVQTDGVVADDANGTPDIYLRDRVAGGTRRINQQWDGTFPGGVSFFGGFTGDGRTFIFGSDLLYENYNPGPGRRLIVAPTSPPSP